MADDAADRARRLAESASTDTVTERLLLGGDEYAGEQYLYDAAPIERLRDHEQPQATLFNDMKGVGIDSKRNTVAPDGSGKSVFVVTGERLLALVGQRDDDWERSVPLEDVTAVDYSTGIMKHRIVVEADTTYHLWVDASYDESTLEAVVNLLSAGGEDGAVADADGADSAATSYAVGDGEGDPVEGDSSSTEDPLETLERLKELHDAGVVSDAEFEEKKAELLDQI